MVDNGVFTDSSPAGIQLKLTGTTASGQQVTMTTSTGSSGDYSFSVPAGTYTITETPPSLFGLWSGEPQSASCIPIAGTLGGTCGFNGIQNIVVPSTNASVFGDNYDFDNMATDAYSPSSPPYFL